MQWNAKEMFFYLWNIWDNFVGDSEGGEIWSVTHLSPDLVSDGMSFVNIEGDPFPQDQIHRRGVGKANNGLHYQVRPTFVWNKNQMI
jgi:hypothetical protein